MTPLLKIDLKKTLQSGPVKIELGCGRSKKPGIIGIDKLDLPGVDIIADFEEGLGFLPDNSIAEVHAYSCLEHVHNFELLMSEIVRVLKKDGRAFIFVPHFSNPYYYSDPTHVRFFGLYTFCYFADQKYQMKRKVPDFYFKTKIKIVSQKLIFDSPFPVRRLIKKSLGLVFNSCGYLREFYEENLCHILPCYGIEIIFSPDK